MYFMFVFVLSGATRPTPGNTSVRTVTQSWQLLKAPLHRWLLELYLGVQKSCVIIGIVRKGHWAVLWNHYVSPGRLLFLNTDKLLIVRSFFLPVQPSSVTWGRGKRFYYNSGRGSGVLPLELPGHLLCCLGSTHQCPYLLQLPQHSSLA